LRDELGAVTESESLEDLRKAVGTILGR
jgi:hypothetical protein